MYADASDTVAQSLEIRRSSCKRATWLTISGEYAPDSTRSDDTAQSSMSKGVLKPCATVQGESSDVDKGKR